MTTAYELAQKEIGTVEWAQGSNPKVVAYYRDAGHPGVVDDSVPWCAAFVGAMLNRAGQKGTRELTARSYLNWGKPVELADARPGDIVVFKRGNSSWQGHVAFFVKRDGAFLRVLGGNQKDAVNVARYPVSSLLGVRRSADAPPASPARPRPDTGSTSGPPTGPRPDTGSRVPDFPAASTGLWDALAQLLRRLVGK